jgi:hypothetical protein
MMASLPAPMSEAVATLREGLPAPPPPPPPTKLEPGDAGERRRQTALAAFTTFGEIAALGFEIEVHCSSCYR